MKKLILRVIFTCLLFLVFTTGVIWAADNLPANELLERGIAQYRAENYDEALQTLLAAKAGKSDSAVTAYYLGLSYKQLGNYREALKQFIDAVTFTPFVQDAYVELIDIYYNLNEFQSARQYIQKAESSNILPGKVAYLKGLVLLKENNTKEAVKSFQRAKELDKELSQAADFQIATAYAKEKRYREAKETLRTLTLIDATSEVSSFAKEYENALTRTLEAYKPWKFTVGAAYQYDDNVIAKPSTEISGLTFGRNRDGSAVGTLNAYYNPLPEGPFFFNAQYSLYDNIHFHIHNFDVLSQTLTIVPGYGAEKFAVTLPVTYNYVLLHERNYLSLLSAKPTISFITSANSFVQLSGGYAYRDMLKPAQTRDEDRNGDIYSGSLGYVYTFKDGKGIANVKYEYSSENTEGINWKNRTNRFTAGLLWPVVQRVNLVLSGDVLLTDYDHVHTVFEKRRVDRIYTAGLGVTVDLVKNLNLNLQYSYNRADSNIAVYDYKRNVYMAGLEYNF